jgi:hypothetical protein
MPSSSRICLFPNPKGRADSKMDDLFKIFAPFRVGETKIKQINPHPSLLPKGEGICYLL